MSETIAEEIVKEALPESLRSIAVLIGVSKTLRLVAALGGTALYIATPERIGADNPLAQLVGVDAARILAGHYRGEVVHIAKASAALRAVRNATIVADHSAGLSKRELALRYGLDVRQIRTIVKKCEV